MYNSRHIRWIRFALSWWMLLLLLLSSSPIPFLLCCLLPLSSSTVCRCLFSFVRRASDNAAQAILYCVFAFFQPFIYCLLRGNGAAEKPRKTRRKAAETKRNIDSAHDTKQVALPHIVIEQRVLCNDHNSLYGMLIACLAFPLSSPPVTSLSRPPLTAFQPAMRS